MTTPRDSAHLTISSVVCGPQFLAVKRCLKVSFRSSSPDGAHRPFGGGSPVNSTASSFKTFSARTLSSAGSAKGVAAEAPFTAVPCQEACCLAFTAAEIPTVWRPHQRAASFLYIVRRYEHIVK